MGAGFFVIAILGCADGSAACTPVATLPTRYESRAECAASTGAALSNNNDKNGTQRGMMTSLSTFTTTLRNMACVS